MLSKPGNSLQRTPMVEPKGFCARFGFPGMAIVAFFVPVIFIILLLISIFYFQVLPFGISAYYNHVTISTPSEMYSFDNAIRKTCQMGAPNPNLFKFLVYLDRSALDKNLPLYGYDSTHLLHLAVHNSCKCAVQFLLEKGVDVNQRDDQQRSPIFFSNRSGELATFLINKGALVTITDNDGKTPLHNFDMSTDFIDVIVSNGVDVNTTDHAGKTPLHYLLQYFNNKKREDQALHLLDLGANPSIADLEGFTPLHYAAMERNPKVLERILDMRSDYDFLNARTVNGNTPISLAVISHDQKSFNLLINRGVDLNLTYEKGKSILHLAVQSDDLYVLCTETLLSHGLEPDLRDEEGKTPLYYANEKTINLLINYGASIDIRDFQGKTPLHYACQNRNSVVIGILCNLGAKADIGDNEGVTPKEIAVEKFRNADQILANCK